MLVFGAEVGCPSVYMVISVIVAIHITIVDGLFIVHLIMID